MTYALPIATAVALAIMAGGWAFYRMKAPAVLPVAPPGPFGTPDKPNRAWARMMFFNGLITIEELNAFYARHPEPEIESNPPRPA